MTPTPASPVYVLTLYVAGTSTRSAHAIESLRKVCHDELDDRVELRVVDIHQDPTVAVEENIVATPTLVKELPPPLERFVGDLLAERLIVSARVGEAASGWPPP